MSRIGSAKRRAAVVAVLLIACPTRRIRARAARSRDAGTGGAGGGRRERNRRRWWSRYEYGRSRGLVGWRGAIEGGGVGGTTAPHFTGGGRGGEGRLIEVPRATQ
jgi:hypothetical protein